MPSPNAHGVGSSNAAATPANRSRSVLWIVAAALLGLLAGFLLQYARLQGVQHDLAESRRAVDVAQLESMLSASVIEAQSGRYEVARQRASDFYTGLQRRVLPAVEPGAQAKVRVMLAERDSIITSLARNDPTTSGTLASVLVRYRETMHQAGLDSSTVAPPR